MHSSGYVLILMAVSSGCGSSPPTEIDAARSDATADSRVVADLNVDVAEPDRGAGDSSDTAPDSEDRRCSIANCMNVYACGFRTSADPDVTGCARRTGVASGLTDAVPYCVNACNAGYLAADLACLAAPATICKLDACQGSPATSDQPCVDACTDARETCSERCPAGTYRECLDCTARCSLDALPCYDACTGQRDASQP
jgi:hypothetical protein